MSSPSVLPKRLKMEVTILQASGLVGKDRSLLSLKKTSDPFVNIVLNNQIVHHTTIQYKTLDPTWNETFVMPSITVDGTKKDTIRLDILDHDVMTSSDPMGSVVIFPNPEYPHRITKPYTEITQWYDIPPDSAKNAKGKIQVKLAITVEGCPSLTRGNIYKVLDINKSNKNNNFLQMGLSWQSTADLDVSCVAITKMGTVSLKDSVYYGNTTNSNESIVHSGDARDGTNDNHNYGDDETLTFWLDDIPRDILAIYIVLTVASPNDATIQQACQYAKVTVRVPEDGTTRRSKKPLRALCTYTPNNSDGDTDGTAMFVLRLEAEKVDGGDRIWKIVPIQDLHPTARNFGLLIPHFKSYSRDLLPNITVDPMERMAILRKGETIRLKEYSPKNAVPSKVTLGLSWNITDGVKIDLDASALCLNANYECIDKVSWQQLNSTLDNNGGAIHHHGDEREGDEAGDDEKIDFSLANIHEDVQYIGFVINSYSGQELDDVDRASCRLYDTGTKRELCTYAMTDASALNGHTALVLGCLYRNKINDDDTDNTEWSLCIVGEAAQGNVVEDNLDEFQNFLKQHPTATSELPQNSEEEEEIIVSSAMPEYVPIAEEEIDLSL